MFRVALPFRPGWVALRDLCGSDEDVVDGTGTEHAVALVDRLLCDLPGASLGCGQAADLSSADRDRVLAAIFRRTFGERIQSTISCTACGQRFDLDFALAELVASLPGEAPAADGTYRTSDGRRFRLPTGRDELATVGTAGEVEAHLRRACVVDGDPDDETIPDAMQAVAPLLDLDLDATCAECGVQQVVHFDLQHYMLARLRDERSLRTYEVHLLARAYRWSLTELMALPRVQRRLYVDLVGRERGAW
jgi:hypothetical protein